MPRTREMLCLALTLSVLFPLSAHGQCSAPETLVTLPASANASAGNGIATDGNWTAVGAPFYSGAVSSSGAVSMFRRDETTWSLHTVLTADDPSGFDHFGTKVSMSGDWLAVGAPFEDQAGSSAGAVYMFRLEDGMWSQQAKLVGSDVDASDHFGAAVDIRGDFLAVGAPEKNDGTPAMGAAYVFRLVNGSWTQDAKLSPGPLDSSDRFGFSVAVDGERVYVGAPGDDDRDLDAGAAYYFERQLGSWIMEQKIVMSDGFIDDQFGWSMDLEDNLLVVGVPHDDDHVFSSGTAFIFFYDGMQWNEEQKLVPADSHITDFFAYSVSLSGDYVLTGCPMDDDNGTQSGSAYVFRRNPGGTWTEESKYLANDTITEDNLGQSVSLAGPYAAVGAIGADGSAPEAGAAYMFRIYAETDCNNNGIEDICEIEEGLAADCNCNGVPDSCDIASGLSLDVDMNNVPDECGTDCDGDLVSDVCEIATGESTDCNGNGVPDNCDVGFGTSLDCNNNGLPDECEISASPGLDCNGNGVLDSCDLAAATSTDCNNNGLPDECDSPSTPPGDCNNNGIEDACEIASGTCNDCNDNGVPDDCDLNLGTSLDANLNLVPDECENSFVRGDANADGSLDIGDVLFVAGYLFTDGAPAPSCFAAADANSDGNVDISDAQYLIFYLFVSGNAPASPFPACGPPPNPACLPCLDFTPCP